MSGRCSGGAGSAPTRGNLHPMDYLYSLYDALLSIHVPNDKARAVVDAMERDMEILSSTLTIRLGSMLMLRLGLLFAALKLT